MPAYEYAVHEVFRLNHDGHAECSRTIRLRNSSATPVEVLIQELQETLPDNADGFIVRDSAGPLNDLTVVTDLLFQKELRIPLRAVTIPALAEHVVVVDYRRPFVARMDRGFMSLHIRYASRNVS